MIDSEPSANRRARRTRGKALLGAWLLALALAATGCGGADATKAASDPPGKTDAAEAAFVVDYMRDWYLWRSELASSDQTYANGASALAALRVPQDRYSFITSAAEYNAFFDEGRTVGFGITYRVENDAGLRLFAVQPLSPAAAAGLLRGDLIDTIDARPVREIVAAEGVSAALGDNLAGIQRTFGLVRDGQRLEIGVVKAEYPLSYVLASRVLQAGGRRIGYVSFYSFAQPGIAPWRQALDELLADGAQDLIVDLRGNGGGLIASAATVGSALGASGLGGRLMTRLSFNDRHSAEDRAFDFEPDPRAGRFERLVWLTSAQTCSASEALIVGLDAYRTAARVGETTCGKPVGFTPPTFGDKIYSIVSFRLQGPTGVTDYFDGLAPTCVAPDDGTGALGTIADPLTAAALSWLANGECPSVQPKTFASMRVPAETGFASQTNLR